MEDETEGEVFTFNESFLMLQKLTSTDSSDRENITALLADHEFNTTDEKMKEQILNPALCIALVQRLDDPFVQTRYNTVMAIINLLISYSQFDIDNIFIFEAHLTTYIQNLLMKYLNEKSLGITEQYTEGEMIKMNKLLKSTIDLLLLIVEIYESDSMSNKLDFNIILKCNIDFILNPGSLSEDIVINSCLFMANILSVRIFPIENSEGNDLINFIQFAEKIVRDPNALKSANEIVIASFITSLFYLYCNGINQKQNESNSAELEFVKYLIDSIYTRINFGLCEKLTKLDSSMKNYINSGEKENKDHHKELKDFMRTTEASVRATLIYLKTFTDVINCYKISEVSPNQTQNEEMNEEELDEKEEEEVVSQEDNSDNPIEVAVSNVLNKIFNSNCNNDALVLMLKNDFLPKLIKFFDNLVVEQFLLNDFDKMIVIKELVYDLEYHTLSLINNVIRNFNGVFDQDDSSLSFIANLINKRLGILEYSHNTDFLSVMLTCLRSILEKKHIDLDINYKSLFIILNNNINESFIKINIIDIISIIFSKELTSKEDNLEVCKLLLNICMIEKDTEVVSHVLNAYFDIYKEDDYDSNFILKSVGVVEMMKEGIDLFKGRVKNAYQLGELDKASYEYAKESLLNLKRFVKYKEKLFQKLKL